MRFRSRLLLALPLAAILAIPALSASAATPVSIVTCDATPAPFCFSPQSVTIPAGSSVTWTNDTGAPHTATADSPGTWTTPTIPGGGSATVTFSTPGTFAYHCAIHPSMHGTIVVTAAATASPTPAATRSPTPAPTPSPTPAATPSPTPSATASAAPSASTTTTPSPTPTAHTATLANSGSGPALPLLLAFGLLVVAAGLTLLARRRRVRA